MHQTLTAIQQQLQDVIAQVEAVIPNNEPLGIAHNNWSLPGLTRIELTEEAQSIIELIENQGVDDVGNHKAQIQDYVRRLQHLQQQTVGQFWGGNAGQAISAYMLTLDGLRKVLKPVLIRDEHAESVVKLKKLAKQLRSMEALLNGLEPRTTALSTMVERIEQAYNAADQLPTDLESLSEARQSIAKLAQEALKDQSLLLGIREKADKLDIQLSKNAADAESVLERCETAYSAATSVGLAAAFSERSDALSKSMWFWVAGLALALAAGSYFGSRQINTLLELSIIPNATTAMIVFNILLSLLSIGAPVWFAWLATKQIGQRFRLAEDYAFKASISRAYEGFRRETARFDEDMETRLLVSALTRFDELPLRLVETTSHGSPWHELASSDAIKQAIKTVPGFAEQVKRLAVSAVSAINHRKAASSPSDASEEK